MIDVCLLLEGTYPYVAGGVSTWVHQLIMAMQHIRFGIVYISAYADPTRRPKYELPGHVIYLKEVALHDYDLKKNRDHRPKKSEIARLRGGFHAILGGDYDKFSDLLPLFCGRDACLDLPTFFTSRAVWDILEQSALSQHEPLSFLDYFWTWRGTMLPLMQILKTDVPPAKVYHSVSTGYAGLLGAMAKVHHRGTYLITEHGIYTHERMLEISQASWIFEQEKRHYRAEKELSFFKKWWVEIFGITSRIAYRYADRLFTLYEGNRIRQIAEGADPSKITIIPNGIDVKSLGAMKRQRKSTPHVGLIGRVVRIKDIKTFLQAAQLVLKKIPEATFYVLGPTDEEKDYFEECKALSEALLLEDRIVFTGRVDLYSYYQFLDLAVLTSLSEAQPYVIMEANIRGIPVVATDVGACREMLEGRDREDRSLGQSGLLTEVANPGATSEAIVRLLKDRALYEQTSKSGIERVKRFYDQDDLLSKYLNVYERAL